MLLLKPLLPAHTGAVDGPQLLDGDHPSWTDGDRASASAAAPVAAAAPATAALAAAASVAAAAPAEATAAVVALAPRAAAVASAAAAGVPSETPMGKALATASRIVRTVPPVARRAVLSTVDIAGLFAEEFRGFETQESELPESQELELPGNTTPNAGPSGQEVLKEDKKTKSRPGPSGTTVRVPKMRQRGFFYFSRPTGLLQRSDNVM